MNINKIQNQTTYFAASQNKNNDDKNPISTSGERAKLMKATVIAGCAFGARALLWLWDEGIIGELLWKSGRKLADKKHPNATGGKKAVLHVGGFLAVTVGFIGLMAAIYTVVKTPEAMYDGKVNAFKKGKDMDVYVKGNNVEKHLYDQMNEKAKDATPEEKKKLSEQYLKLKAAKNQTPDFIEVKSQSEMKNK